MKRNRVFIGFMLIMFAISCDLFQNESGMPLNEDIWVNGYLASWQHNPETDLIKDGVIKTDEIDWDAITHLTYFSLNIAEDGSPSLSLDPLQRNNFNTDRLENIVPAAHAHDTKIIFSVGGGGNYDGFSAAIADTSRARFINTITELIIKFGFDGVNLNMTPIETTDYNNYKAFVYELSSTLDTLRTLQNERPLLTVAATKTDGISAFFADIQNHFDQINILTYDMAQPWRGWVAWHNSALYNKEVVFENEETNFMPSIDQKVQEWIHAGVARNKIGIAINFNGSVWSGVNYLGKWLQWPTQDLTIYKNQPYTKLLEDYDLSDYKWDKNAQVPYLNSTNPRYFVSFENEESIKNKIEYAKSKRLGGVMLWELGAGFAPQNDPKDPLLKAVKNNLKKIK